MSKLVNQSWPDDVRLKMIEKSEFYSEPQVYQYGFYDGYQHAQSQTQELIEQNMDLFIALSRIVERQFDNAHRLASLNHSIAEAKELLTKYKKT